MSRVAKLGAVTALVAVGAVCFAALNTGSGLFTGRLATAGQAASTAEKASSVVPSQRGNAVSASALAESPETYIIVYREPAVAGYKGGIGTMAAPARRADKSGRDRLDVNSASAVVYASYLQNRQAKHEASIAGVIGRQPAVSMRMQHAINASIVKVTASEAARIAKLPDVQLVEANRDIALDTDVGPALIGAPALWNGTTPGAAGAYQGEGVVVGIIDSGINFESPSFAAVDPVDGYTHANPVQGGGFLGTCAPGGVDAGRCNTKLIGGYDFVCNAPGNQCGVTGVREEPGFGDTNSHGSHTASTTAGNRRDVQFAGNTVRISGVAPRANIIAYDVCYTNTTTGQGLCPGVSSLAAVNQAIQNGIVDVLNFSIGGGTSPWNDSVSLAFLNAVDAGIYVASSAGNSGPAANTLGHLEPWVAATAASQHGRGNFVFTLSVTGPGTPPASVSAVAVNPGAGGSAVFTAAIPSSPLRASPTFTAANDGCNAYPSGTFAGSIALVRRGTCSFTIKANAAAAAGAIAVVIANNDTPGLIPSVPDTTIQVFGVNGADGIALNSFASANANATARIAYPAVRQTNVVDALADFSSRGPAGNFDLVKPDMTAPGSLILATVSGTTITGFPNAVDLMSGTSMASPHNAGAAALLRQARPTWTPTEIKSALMLTAKTGVLLEDQVSPADAFARGAGRIRVDKAVNAGLVMDETKANYLAANPATGGDPKTLNMPSYGNRGCYASCSFTRTFRNPTSVAKTWYVRLNGLRGSVSQPVVTVAPGASVSINVTIDSRSQPANGTWRMGNLRLSTLGGDPEVLELPIAIAVQPQAIVLPASAAVSAVSGQAATGSVSFANTGSAPLTYQVDSAGQGVATLYNRTRNAAGNGYASGRYSDNTAIFFTADDFEVRTPTQITSLSAEGFTVSNLSLASTATQVGFAIYPSDANGLPAGNPQTAAAAAAFAYDAAPNSAGISVAGNGISLDLAAANQSVTLQPGKYWLVVHTRSAVANRWAWYVSDTGVGGGFASYNATAGTWAANTAYQGLAMRVRGSVGCGASWLASVLPASGTVAGGASRALTMNVNAAGLAPGSYFGNLCIASNDAVLPRAATTVNLTVTAPSAKAASRR